MSPGMRKIRRDISQLWEGEVHGSGYSWPAIHLSVSTEAGSICHSLETPKFTKVKAIL